jgi:hypothetical protein
MIAAAAGFRIGLVSSPTSWSALLAPLRRRTLFLTGPGPETGDSKPRLGCAQMPEKSGTAGFHTALTPGFAAAPLTTGFGDAALAAGLAGVPLAAGFAASTAGLAAAGPAAAGLADVVFAAGFAGSVVWVGEMICPKAGAAAPAANIKAKRKRRRRQVMVPSLQAGD